MIYRSVLEHCSCLLVEAGLASGSNKETGYGPALMSVERRVACTVSARASGTEIPGLGENSLPRLGEDSPA